MSQWRRRRKEQKVQDRIRPVQGEGTKCISAQIENGSGSVGRNRSLPPPPQKKKKIRISYWPNRFPLFPSIVCSLSAPPPPLPLRLSPFWQFNMPSSSSPQRPRAKKRLAFGNCCLCREFCNVFLKLQAQRIVVSISNLWDIKSPGKIRSQNF